MRCWVLADQYLAGCGVIALYQQVIAQHEQLTRLVAKPRHQQLGGANCASVIIRVTTFPRS
jgi:hypothetical protein